MWCRKVANYLGDVLEDQRDKLAENLLAAGVDLATYITQFRQARHLHAPSSELWISVLKHYFVRTRAKLLTPSNYVFPISLSCLFFF
jgi:hypothetical protein